MTKPRKSALLAVFLFLNCSLTWAQGEVAPPRPQKRIITKTRLVAIFSELENQLLEALRNTQHASVDAFLSEDFQLWTPTPPGDPVPREKWRSQALAENLKAFSMRQMAARSVDENTALVSFVLTKTVDRAGKSSTRDYFVVDLWQKKDENWKLSDRYASSGPPQRVKPVAMKPSGKN
jgi:hypothetical protein